MMIFAHQAKFVSRHRPWRAPERCLVEASIPRAYSQSPILSAWWNPFSKEASSDESTPSKADAERPPVPPPASTTPSASEPANPGSFLRGEGLAKEDIRDIGQELFLRNKHKVDDKVKGPQEMPADLLKFIQDVGPAKQSVDKQFTAPRLLEKENIEELEKKESSRQMIRQRKRMPLVSCIIVVIIC